MKVTSLLYHDVVPPGRLDLSGFQSPDANIYKFDEAEFDRHLTVIQGRARYPVNVRLPRDSRDNLDALRQVLVGGSEGRDAVPLSQLATVQVVQGPAMIRDENAMLTGYVYLDLDGRDAEDYIAEAAGVLARKLSLPAGYTLSWSGQYEAFQRMNRRLLQVVPLTLSFVAVLIYWNTRSAAKTGLVLLAVPFSAIGAVWGLYLLGYPMSPAAWVGLIALLGVDAETGTFMVLYLDLAWQKAVAEGRMRTSADLRQAVLTGAVRRIRPKFMTVATMFLGLVPILWSTGAGAEVMKRIAAPMVGGLATSFLMELLLYPVLYERWKSRSLPGCPPPPMPRVTSTWRADTQASRSIRRRPQPVNTLRTATAQTRHLDPTFFPFPSF